MTCRMTLRVPMTRCAVVYNDLDSPPPGVRGFSWR
jgi:hypothetical protein